MRQRRRGGGGSFVILAILVLGVLVLGVYLSQNAAPTPPATTATPGAVPPVYLGVPRSSVEGAWGTPTVPDADTGYGSCPAAPASFAWLVTYDQATDRAALITPKGGCTDNPPSWRQWAMQVLPPDAHFVSEQTEDGGTVLQTYTSAWLALRLGCGTIQVRGTDTPDQFSAFTAC